ncbi:MAG: aspartate carbamoyltransferase, partial [Candidatus Bathyarchaeia archaeon]
MTQHFNFKGRDIVSIKDFPRQELDYVLEVARKIDPTSPEAANLLNGKVMGTLFFEPSTRTRLSFEAAMKRLGGNTIGFTEPGASSVEKGETLADTVRVVENYVDVIVMRHPREGSARLAAECVSIPVINAGSGAEEHPTQAFLDMLTIRNENGKLDGLNIGLVGDLRYGRTVHSLAYALSHYDISLHLVAPPQLRMRKEVLAAAKSRIRITESSGIEEVLPKLD